MTVSEPASVALRELVGDASVLDQLTEQECADLLDLVESARRARARAMLLAVEEALCHLPRVLRTPARKLLLPEVRR